jgi:choice-of-anchor B domain-containing protein
LPIRIAALCITALVASMGIATPALGGGPPPISHHVTLRKQIDVYTGVNDCWGYRAPNGTELAIYGHNTGTSFVNATDPPNAVEIANIPGATSIWRDMFTYSHYCYIVTEGSGPGTGLQIVDLANPLAPVLVTTYTGNGFSTAHNIFIDVEEGIAYAVGAGPDGGMRILSLANPTSPVQLDNFDPYYIHDIFVGDGVGYAGAIYSGTLAIIDLSNPSNPTTIAAHSYPGGFTHNAWPNAARTHCTTTDETNGGHLQIWDITDLQNVDLASEFEVPQAIIHDVRIRNDVAYLSYYSAGAHIVDLFDPNDPVEIGYYDTSPTSGYGFSGDWGVYPFRMGDVFYASDRQTGLFILEFTGSLAGRVQGLVRDASTLAPLSGATVELLEEEITISTSGTGTYSKAVPGGAATIRTKKFGYATSTSSVTIPERGTLTHNVDLAPLPFGSVKITVTADESGSPLAGVLGTVLDSPLATQASNGSGEIVFTGVPAGPPWTVRLARFGRALTDVSVVAPAGGQSTYSISLPRGFYDNFDWDQAWVVGDVGDNAVDGIWERDIPVPSFSDGIVGADVDSTGSGQGWAYITENHHAGAFVGTSDVDGGQTTVLTPVFNAAGLGALTLSYDRWFSNRIPTPSTDRFRCDVSTNGGGSWTNLETVTTGTDSWANVVVPLPSGTSQMRLRFIAEDLSSDTYVEAGVDEVKITSSVTSAGEVGIIALPQMLQAPSPNPFRESSTIAMHVSRPGAVALEVYDVGGRRIARLLHGDRVATGDYRVKWEARDDHGERVAPGVYFIRLSTPDGEAARKITVLR